MSIVLGIDPGTTTIGYAFIEKKKSLELLDYGIISTTPKIENSLKLFEIGHDMKELIEKFSPDVIAVEKLYFTSNQKTGISVAECRGVILYEAMKHNLPIFEFTPLQVKKALTSNGKATKKQMQLAVKMIMRLKEIPKPDDAADAIAIAYIGALQKF